MSVWSPLSPWTRKVNIYLNLKAGEKYLELGQATQLELSCDVWQEEMRIRGREGGGWVVYC